MNSWEDVAPILGVVALFSVLAVGMTIKDANEEQTKREAIKADLVQDNEGHWVRPELESLVDD